MDQVCVLNLSGEWYDVSEGLYSIPMCNDSMETAFLPYDLRATVLDHADPVAHPLLYRFTHM